MATIPENSCKDSDLVKTCKRELPYITTAFEELVRLYESTVFNSCRYLLGDPEDAEEVCQDVFMRVFHHIKKFDHNSSFRTWLFRITRNCCYTKIKQLQRQKIFNRDYVFIEKQMPVESENANSMSAHMEEALDKLSLEDREMITLRFISNLSLKEIAETIEIQLSAAKMRYYRALERLKKEIKQ